MGTLPATVGGSDLLQRFESAVALVLTLLTATIIVVALYRLSVSIVAGLVLDLLDPLDHKVFQLMFGNVMTLLIALARKFIILDVHELSPAHLFGLAATTLALGATYWMLRDRDDRVADEVRKPSPRSAA